MTSAYAVDYAEFRANEDLVIGLYSGQFGYNMSCCQELLTACIQHGNSRDLWADAYHALQRYESAELVVGDDAEIFPAPPVAAERKRARVTHITCLVERECDRVQDAAGRFTVSIDTKGRVEGEAVATSRRKMRIAGMRVDPMQSVSEIGLAVLMHLASIEHQSAVEGLMARMRRGASR